MFWSCPVGSLEDPRPCFGPSATQFSHMAYLSTLQMEAVGSSETMVQVSHIACYFVPHRQ
jgi:hypothetical protein